jgi:transposase/putative transposon-encoded protein
MKPNISKLATHLGADRKTIRKALNGFVPTKTKKKDKYLDAFRYEIIDLLSDENRAFDYMKHLYNYLKREHNIVCSYSTFRRYIITDEDLSKLFKKSKPTDIFTQRFETEAGKQAQFDLKEKVPIVDKTGTITKVNVATLTMGFSRLNIREIVLDTSYDIVIAFLAMAFDKLGGVPEQIVIDNIKCLVDKPRRNGEDAVLNSKFLQFLSDYNLKAFPCMPARPQTKGKTETQNKVPAQLKNYGGTYEDLHDVHRVLEIINTEDNESISQATNLPPVFLWNIEKDKLQPLPTKEVRMKYYLKLKEVVVSNESLISFKSNKYSVPKQFIGKKVGRTIKNNRLQIYYNNKVITEHQITDKKLNIKQSHNLFYEKKLNSYIVENKIILQEMEAIAYDND